MGSGCSSPLRRLGGKRAKAARRDSSLTDDIDDQQAVRETIADKHNPHQHKQELSQQQTSSSAGQAKCKSASPGQKFMLENEITIQSEQGDDHPSTTSNYTDARLHNEETKLSELSGGLEPKSLAAKSGSSTAVMNAAARIMGLNGGYAPHDRHLLVSPALSPAPSTCYSPSPASSSPGHPCSIDLNDLNEAFRVLTLGLLDTPPTSQSNNPTQAGTKPTPTITKQQQSSNFNLHNQYTQQQLIQNPQDLINCVSVIFLTADNFQPNHGSNSQAPSIAAANTPTPAPEISASQHSIETLANHIESNLKLYCDEHLFNLRFLNLSQTHLSERFHVNNLPDVTSRILEQEYLENGQRMMVVVLSSSSNSISTNNGGPRVDPASSNANRNQLLDKRLLPTKMEAQFVNKMLHNANVSDKAKDLLKRWYNQVGTVSHLNPIYLVYPKILDESRDERDQAWKSWLVDSDCLIKSIDDSARELPDFADALVGLKSLFEYQIEFITKESAIQKRTLLIKSHSQPVTSGNNNGNANTNSVLSSSQTASNQIKDTATSTSLYELTRLLADPNKLSLKRSMGADEFTKTINDWILDVFGKFLDGIMENRIVSNKYIPPIIERGLFIELTCQRHRLEHHLANVTENFEAKCKNFYTSQISPILSAVVDSMGANQSNLVDSSDPIALETVQKLNSHHLVFISGPRGCGKSTLFAQMIKLTAISLTNRAQLIYRFCGTSLDSLSPNRLLRSICEQFCQTQGENITAASYIYSARLEIMNALNKTLRRQNTSIFLDGLDSLNQSADGAETLDLDWLCEIEANPSIKIFVMLETDSVLYKRALGTYTDATFISLDNPSISEWAQMLNWSTRTQRLNSAGNLYEEIKKLDADSGDPKDGKLNYLDVSNIIRASKVRQLCNESNYPELSAKVIQEIGQVQQVILSRLRYLLSSHQLAALFIVLSSSRNGLSEWDLVNVMTLISQANGGGKFTSTLLSYLRLQLGTWLLQIVCDKTVKIWIQPDVAQSVIEHYAATSQLNIVREVREQMIEYFSRQLRAKSSRGSIFKPLVGSGDSSAPGGPFQATEPRDRVSVNESLWLATQASELAHLFLLTNPARAREHLMNKHQFFSQFLYGSMPEEFIEDHRRLRRLEPTSGSGSSGSGKKPSSGTLEELQILVNFVCQSVHPLRYDGSQVYSQIYCRAHEVIMKGSKSSRSKRFNDILAASGCPPVQSLLPISDASVDSFIKTRIGQPTAALSSSSDLGTMSGSTGGASSNLSAPSANGQRQLAAPSARGPTGGCLSANSSSSGGNNSANSKQHIYTIKDNHRHIIVVYPDKGCLSVWDLFEERAVRTIDNLDQPRDIKMVDQRRAVILCNRELRVYDLDSGELLTKLKGVMNQKMPFYEVFGDNYVVALARNRMYVNMLSLNTGELETTFKVGEDRFLNSLLVSANGGICVCGDETQKPFPLLVWNLNERRLMYDLRLERHEFITRMSAISDDGHFVVSVCRQLGDASEGGAANSSSQQQQQTSSTSTMGSLGSSAGPSATAASAGRASPNFIVIYDLSSGTLFKKWKPGIDSCAVAIALSSSRSGKVMNSTVDRSILVWDLATGSRRHTLIGHSAPVDVIRVQNNRLFSMDSTCRDQSLRIWDIEDGNCLAVFSPDAPISCCQMSVRGDALVCSFAAETRLSTLVLCKNETVSDVVRRNKRRKSSKSLYIFDEPAGGKKS